MIALFRPAHYASGGRSHWPFGSKGNAYVAKRKQREDARPCVSEDARLPAVVEGPELTPLNFKVSRDFHREFKTFAAQHSKSMVGILQEAFALLKDSYGKQH